MRTNRPDARAAVADAAFSRSCGNVHAAMQPTSWKRPFKATISVDFKQTFRRVMFELTHRGTKRPLDYFETMSAFTRMLLQKNASSAETRL
jgi:hypothetical protein